MNSEFNDLERMFSEGLYNHEVNPPAHVWANIQKQKRRGLLLYKFKVATFFFGIALIGITAYYFQANTAPINSNTAKPASQLNASEAATESINPTHSNEGVKIDSKISDKKITEQNITLKKQAKNSQKFSSNKLGFNQLKSTLPITKNEDLAYDTHELEMSMIFKNGIKLRYLIYPSLTQYVYTSKRLVKKYQSSNNDDKDLAKTNKYSFEIGVGPNYVTRKLTGSDIDLRNESESALFSIQTGFKFNYQFHPKWQIQTGLSLENRAEKIAFDKSEIGNKLSITSRQVTVYHPILKPQIITITDSVQTSEIINYNFKTTNKYTTISIPLLFGYNFGIGKVQYRISAGSLFNIYSINTAHNLARVNDKIALIPYEESTKIKSSLIGSAAIYIPLNLNYQIFAELSHYQNLNNRLFEEAANKQKNSGTNLGFGLKINLIK